MQRYDSNTTSEPVTVTPEPATQAPSITPEPNNNSEVGVPDSISQGNYNIVNANGGRYLNVYAGNDANKTNVCVWEKDYSPEQKLLYKGCIWK